MDLLPGITPTAQALNAEKVRMEVIAQNIANAQTTRDANGNPYQRKVVAFESFLNEKSDMSKGVRVAGIVPDTTQGPLVYSPNHPHANPDGMVRMPNVQTSREMVDLIASSRAYEANLSVAKTSRMMAKQALAISSK